MLRLLSRFFLRERGRLYTGYLKVTLAYSSFLKPKSNVRKKIKPQAFASPVVDEPWLASHQSL